MDAVENCGKGEHTCSSKLRCCWEAGVKQCRLHLGQLHGREGVFLQRRTAPRLGTTAQGIVTLKLRTQLFCTLLTSQATRARAQIMKEDDNSWPQPDRVGRQELEIVMGQEHISFTTTKLGSLLQVQQSQDPEGLRIFYYLVQVRAIAAAVVLRLQSLCLVL